MNALKGGAPAALGEGAQDNPSTHPTSLPEGLACYTGTYGVACRLARLGFPVFPCRKGGKEPATPHGFKDATTDTDRLAEWWAVSDDGTTRPLNLGLPTGRASGVWVLDLDGPEGLETLECLEQEHGRLPDTVTVGTPSGGRHLYFRLPPGVEIRCAARVLPGVDVRGEGGYVVVPPSRVGGRPYRWVRLGEVAQAPDWLLEALHRPSPAAQTTAFSGGAVRWCEGERNTRLFREGCALRRRGYSAAEIEAALLVLNAGRCDPPLPEAEVEKIARNAAQYPPGGVAGGEELEPDAAPRLAPPPEVPRDALPDPLRDLVDRGAEAGLPAVCLLGAGLAAAAGAIGGGATIKRAETWSERPSLWCAMIGPPGAGKSPALRLATRVLHEHDAALLRDEERWESGRVLASDTTLEALARALRNAGGALLLEIDELAELLEGLGRYKRRADSDRARALALWDGAPWVYERVNGGGPKNALRFAVPHPTVPIAGCLTLERHRLLGSDSDGMRPRWLVWVTTRPAGAGRGGSVPKMWERTVRQLLEARHAARTWALDEGAEKVLRAAQRRWESERRTATAQLARALDKAPRQALRIALVLAELDNPGAGGAVGPSVAESAVEILGVALNGWRALPEGRTLALSRRDRTLDSALDVLVTWLDERGGKATRREVLHAHVAGVRSARDLDALLERYESVYPGCVTREIPPGGGPPAVVIHSPRISVVASGNNVNKRGGLAPRNPSSEAKNERAKTLVPPGGNNALVPPGGNNVGPPRGCVRRACAAHVDPEAPDNGFRPGCRFCAAATERVSSRDDTLGGGGL